MAPPPKVAAEQGNASARSSSGNSINNNNSVGGATGAVPKQQTPTNGAPSSGVTASAAGSRSARSRRQQEHLGEPDLDFVEPLQHETLKTLNDLLQRARITNGKNRSPAEQQLSTKETRSPGQQKQRDTLRQLAAEQNNYDSAEQLQEQQQRYRFPVRPVQRVQHQPSSSSSAGTGAPAPSSALLRLRQSTPPNATVGVVIPNATTSNGNGHLSGNEEQPPTLTAAGLQQLVHRLLGVQSLGPRIEAGRSQVEVLRSLLELDENLNSRRQQSSANLTEQINSMVHEINPTEQDEGVVNSTSLEDVALSEMSDNRAQSIQSLHSVLETPTPDTTPSFDELQQRLEASNRNMQHLQDEQAKLLHIQNLAKSHLSEMEQLRQQADRLPHNSNGGEAPKYESVQQVQDDMASLVGRMKNLTAFIHNQNELSTVLGDDGPEILAEQQALQEKLESLRTQREDMRNLVDELNSINRTARESARETARVIKEETPTPPAKPVPVPVAAPAPAKERVVPVEYQRNVPIMRQEAANAAQRALHAQAMINQKTADIEALKAQMARLKGMLNTVTQIEESTPSMGGSLERRSEERTSMEKELPEEIAQRVFALNDVTSELRAEAASLQKERDRILALKAEIERRKQQAAAAVQMGEEALKRSSLTPTPTPMRQQQVAEDEDPSEVDTTSLQATPTKEQLRDELRLQCERLRKEYEQKQRELEQRYVASNNTTSEADDEGNDDTDSDKYFANVRTASSATLKRAASASTVVEQRRGQQTNLPSQQAPPPPAPPSTLLEDDLNVTLDTLSLGNDSLPSSSNRSQYMPPPMPPVPGIWASHNSGNSWHGQQPIYGQASSSTGTEFKQPPTAAQVGSSNASGSNASADAVLLQQFMQTQQMLINSVCQCNQTLWHQQREIDNLNNQLHTLQDRFNVVACQDHSFGLRSESVPPPNLPGMGQMPNNLCLGNSRAQSEQLFNFGAHQSAFSNYQRSCHRTGSESHHHQQQQHQQQPFLNNAAPPPPPTHYNNETPLSPPTYRSSPGPIFMNHHNNTIHQNNSNLRTQNQHANNLHSLPEGAAGGGAPGGGITLNNQVPPGNRANNYWDNFRSHSRQNLLSNKSNEELNVDLQQYRCQRARPSYFQPPHLMPPQTTRSGLTHQQQQQQQRRHFFESPLTALHGSTSNGSNNLNNSGSAARKRDWREDQARNRDHDDEDVDEVEENHDNIIFGSGRRRNRRRPQLSTLRDEEPEQPTSSNLNMNVNYGNSPLYQRNKVPAKPTTSTVSLTPLQQRHLRFDFELPAHYMDYIELPQITPMDNTPILGQEPSPADESNVMEQTEETASEELNRNLLVNALKNDKFTTKFYESIKEDVYRRLETLFEQQQQQQQQQQNQQLQQSQEPHSLRKALNQEEIEPSEDAEATESRSETPLEVMRLQLDNDRPEDEKASPVKQLTVVIPQNGHDLDEMEATASAVAPAVRSENEQQVIEGKVEQDDGSGAGATVELAPDHELIEYIIRRIRNQTHNNTVINDSLLAEVSKLTATAAQNSTASSPLISPKRIYAKIKKMDMPRQRDEFLLWYRSYLEQLFVVEQPQDTCKAKSKVPPQNAGSPSKQTNKRVREQSQSQSQDSNNDADLAEADQKNVSSSGNGDLECENNENPGEEADNQAAAESSGAEKKDSSLE
ncbi:uncharacterized protein LOC108095436 [Drosophila ficusphila]|uniref:uncharacterized protein LOC108095436 n=1 Tax=Drosophila ficusphila TaxID=30025 RepID=UPI0007E71B08|nr:uncharacterized protein LOC108095436 [Drosophila ficusphila]